MSELIRYEAARRALAEAHRVDEVKEIYDRATALAVYAAQAKDGELIAHATGVRMRAIRRLGEIMEEQRKTGLLAKGTKRQLAGRTRSGGVAITPPESSPTLASQGIDKNLAKTARKAAAMPEEQFKREVSRAVDIAKATIGGETAVLQAARQRRHDERKATRERREAELAAKIEALPEAKYGVILADPEWKFGTFSDKGLTCGSADNHYPTSEIAAIKARPVASIAADDCVLFLWATVPMLAHALDVMAAWGFRYVSNFVWVKERIGQGYWNRNQHEHLLIGVRGCPPAPAQGTQWPSVIQAPARGHSVKPDEVCDLIGHYFPNLPKIELNARVRRPGFDCWGAEAPTAEPEPVATP
jgi:N6-adenosine-specific RNA methylase IME4